MNAAQMNRPTFKQRVFQKLYPWELCFAPEAPAEYKDCIHHDVTVVLSFADRVRVLLSGRVRVSSRIVTEHATGNTIASAVSHPIARCQVDK